jgi:hypothetical protein
MRSRLVPRVTTLACAVLVSAVLVPGARPAGTATGRTGTDLRLTAATASATLTVTEDTYVTQHDPDGNRGADPQPLACSSTCGGQTGYERRMLVKFRVDTMPLAGCPASATLRLWSKVSRSTVDVLTAYPVDPASWSEFGVTWNTQPPVGAAIGSHAGAPAGDWLSVDVSSALHGAGDYAFELRETAGSEAFLFAGREDTTLNKPAQLAISATDPGPGADLAPGCAGAWWGLYRSGNADISVNEGCPPSDTTVCRRFDAFRRYQSFSQLTGTSPNQTINWPSSNDATLASGGRIMFLDVTNRCFGSCPTSFNGQPLPPPVVFDSPAPADFRGSWFDPNDVADGKLDSILHAAAGKLAAFPARLVLDLSGEPDSQVSWMTDATMKSRWLSGYQRMLRHVHALFAADGVTNVVWNYVVGGFSGDSTIYQNSYPGDGYVDWITWDPYDTGCTSGSPYATFNRFYSRLENGLLGTGARAKPYAIGEYGFGTGCQVAYLNRLVADLELLPKIHALIYFNRTGQTYTLSTQGWTAFTQAGTDPYLQRSH